MIISVSIEEYYRKGDASPGLHFGNRTLFLIVGIFLAVCIAATVGLFVIERSASALVVLLSIPGAILSSVAAGFAYRYARIATLAVGSPPRLCAQEAESVILMRALEVFGNSERALEWMRENNPALDNEAPIRVIQSEDGRREVLNILGRIQHGVII